LISDSSRSSLPTDWYELSLPLLYDLDNPNSSEHPEPCSSGLSIIAVSCPLMGTAELLVEIRMLGGLEREDELDLEGVEDWRDA
jgi:hypothetical protein